MEIKREFTYQIPTKIMFGCGQVKNFHKCDMPGKKALIVITSGKSVKANGYLESIEKELTTANIKYAVYDKAFSNPILENVDEGVAFGKSEGCDFVIGLGGGSAIDTAKAIALMITNEGGLWDYMQAGSGKKKPLENEPLPLIAIPTTAGTGTESDPAFVITKEDTNEKQGLYCYGLFPTLAIVDPELMLSVPAKFTAYQGFDALFHSTEGVISNKNHLMCNMFAMQAIELVGKNLKIAVNDGNNITAREAVALGSTISGMQLASGSLTSAHALEHAISAYHNEIAHGAGLVFIAVAYYTRFAKIPELHDRFIDMAKAMGVENPTKPVDFVNALKRLIDDCGLSELKMSDFGITPDEFPKFVENAHQVMGSKFYNDMIVLTDEEYVEIYKQSYR